MNNLAVDAGVEAEALEQVVIAAHAVLDSAQDAEQRLGRHVRLDVDERQVLRADPPEEGAHALNLVDTHAAQLVRQRPPREPLVLLRHLYEFDQSYECHHCA